MGRRHGDNHPAPNVGFGSLGDIDRARLLRPLQSGKPTWNAEIPKFGWLTSANEQEADLAA